MTDDLAALRAVAEKWRHYEALMLEIGEGIGGVGVVGCDACCAFDETFTADRVLSLIARAEAAESRLATLQQNLTDLPDWLAENGMGPQEVEFVRVNLRALTEATEAQA